jgi:hypothetical protein
MDELNLIWIGQRGTGKQTQIHKALAHVAQGRGVHFQIRKSAWSTETNKRLQRESEQTEAQQDETETPQQGEGIPYETSLVHLGFDIARMSMQDKNYIASLLERLGYGTEVAIGKKKQAVKRILVFYHAHLLSHDSVLQLQMALEQHEGSLVIWCSSELPMPYELVDWFVEIPVAGRDMTIPKLKQQYGVSLLDWSAYFDELVQSWSKKPMTLARIQEIRDWVYFCLQRNLRWQEVTHYLLESILQSQLPADKIQRAVAALAKEPSTGGGQTLGSYRIPIAWEHLGIEVASALAYIQPPKTVQGLATAVINA